MHIDARKLPDNSVIDGDICIVGAGAAGISIALDWIDSPHKVILLESGGFEYDHEVQKLINGSTTGQKYFPLISSRIAAFGGTTGHWAGMCSPMDNIDFMKRDWVPHSGWPITRQDLDPYYERAHEALQLGAYNYDLAYWQEKTPDLAEFALDKEVVYTKLWKINGARFGQLYKESIEKARNIHLYTYATLTNILGNEGLSEIKEVTIKNTAGKTHTVRAKHFILAGGSIQNARMLLASNTQSEKGVGNDNDNVGRYFMEHLEIQSAEIWLYKPFRAKLYSYSGDGGVYGELAISEKAQREHRILNGTAGLVPLSLAKGQTPRIELWQDDDPRKSMDRLIKNWTEAALEAKAELYGEDEDSTAPKTAEEELMELLALFDKLSMTNSFETQTRIEQSPNPDSRVTLGSERDALGMPRVNLHWKLSEIDKRSIRTIYQLIGEQMGLAGLGRVCLKEFLQDENDNTTWPEGTNAGWHHMGTTRMSDDPKTGVVDANCQVHGISNLYVAGAGCFATSAAPNPTLTLVALSIRLSDHVKQKMNAI
ncbi:MAG: GMC family oxidoreductase [Saprospiraceae bacterium]|nr:GMC family oxidoreductase [Saprospiraceae bacterium]